VSTLEISVAAAQDGPVMVLVCARILCRYFPVTAGVTPCSPGGAGRPGGQLVAAASPVKTARTSPMAGSWPTGSGSGRCAWIW
jgi:hypothetical protein